MEARHSTDAPAVPAGAHRLSMPRVLLHLEGLVVLAGAVACYAWQGYGWWTFVLLLLVPDLAIIPYAVSRRAGQIAYNLLHTYLGPVVLGVVSLIGGASFGMQGALIWAAHIGLDRMLGFGLKYAAAFQDTHLGRV